ncbi:MAG: NrdR family transcriptional regulator [Candidatus Berkelbacteria bacterium Athens1014_28]|uniref:Transcriptional repressor NrdR n=1 Tax=Candidatus Berkelbacteria bacterium Athens1014_28 TaxID=2017145 RepID=A0A554LN55_9BACT|nr:MAG: NrdR family transcriptional regulator [Candidatus Berkelbacteria bacterium Athens1014_28]
MLCSKCKKGDTKVVDSRENEDGVRRRRECLSCGHRFTTHERFDSPRLLVKKRDGSLENFNRKKIEQGVVKSFEKRLPNENKFRELIDDIEQKIFSLNENLVSTSTIGKIVSKKLKGIDEVAYLRFISVYKSFSSAKSFASEAKKLIRRKNVASQRD